PNADPPRFAPAATLRAASARSLELRALSVYARTAPPIPLIGVTMPKLIYAAISSLDGYVEDEAGNFDWAAPDGEVHAFVNDLERPIGTYLYGRRMYETMAFWETAGAGTDQTAVSRDFAQIWRAAEKIVYSRSLET